MPSCPICLDLDPRPDMKRWITRDPKLVKHNNHIFPLAVEFEIPSLSTSARQGCLTCSMISTGIQSVAVGLSAEDQKMLVGGRIIVQKPLPLQVELLTNEDESLGCFDFYQRSDSSKSNYEHMMDFNWCQIRLIIETSSLEYWNRKGGSVCKFSFAKYPDNQGLVGRMRRKAFSMFGSLWRVSNSATWCASRFSRWASD